MIETNREPVAEFFSEDRIRELSNEEIFDMSEPDLIAIIRLGRIPFIEEERLHLQEKELLCRLAFMARQSCINRI